MTLWQIVTTKMFHEAEARRLAITVRAFQWRQRFARNTRGVFEITYLENDATSVNVSKVNIYNAMKQVNVGRVTVNYTYFQVLKS